MLRRVLFSLRSLRRRDPLRTILVADSDKNHRAWIANVLSGRGYSIVQTESGEEALARIAAGGIDLLVSAILMPSMDGFAVLRSLREIAAGVPVIIVASGLSNMDWVYAKDACLPAAAYAQPVAESFFVDRIRDLIASAPG